MRATLLLTLVLVACAEPAPSVGAHLWAGDVGPTCSGCQPATCGGPDGGTGLSCPRGTLPTYCAAPTCVGSQGAAFCQPDPTQPARPVLCVPE